MSMDLNAILSGVTVGAITFSGVLRALFLLLIGLIVIRILMNIVDKMLDRSQKLVSCGCTSVPQSGSCCGSC